MDQKLAQELEGLLNAERARLESELASFATKDPRMKDDWDAGFPREAASGDRPDEEEQADIREEYEADLAGEQTLERRLRDVRQALERIRENSYGTCRACGQPIPEERLRANPAAEYDIAHEPRDE